MDQSAVVVSAEAEDCELSEGFGAAWIVLHQTLNVISPWKLETRGSWSTETPVTPSVTSIGFSWLPTWSKQKPLSQLEQRDSRCVCLNAVYPHFSLNRHVFCCAHEVWDPVFRHRKEEAQTPPLLKKVKWFFLYFGRWTDRTIRRYLLAPDYKLLHPLPAFFPDFPSFSALESTLFYYSPYLYMNSNFGGSKRQSTELDCLVKCVAVYDQSADILKFLGLFKTYCKLSDDRLPLTCTFWHWK